MHLEFNSTSLGFESCSCVCVWGGFPYTGTVAGPPAGNLVLCFSSFYEEFASFFSVSREWPFEDEVADVCAGLTVVTAPSSFFQSLEDTIEYLTDADECIEKQVSTRTHIGSALSGWPKGKRLIADLRARKLAAVATATYNDKIAKVLDDLDEVLRGADDGDFNAPSFLHGLAPKLEGFMTIMQEATQKGMPQFLMKREDQVAR